ncbi:MAG: GNAT family N-acetyltransferase [Erysipelothrix sp.]
MTLLKASLEDLTWVNDQYENIGFAKSNFENEFITIVEHEGYYAGLGRLVKLRNNEVELGGIYILDDFRGLSLARKLVEGLIATAQKEGFRTIYCLPFKNLQNFYGSFGFNEIETFDNVNYSILKKHAWCNETYEEKVLLMKIDFEIE